LKVVVVSPNFQQFDESEEANTTFQRSIQALYSPTLFLILDIRNFTTTRVKLSPMVSNFLVYNSNEEKTRNFRVLFLRMAN